MTLQDRLDALQLAHGPGPVTARSLNRAIARLQAKGEVPRRATAGRFRPDRACTESSPRADSPLRPLFAVVRSSQLGPSSLQCPESLYWRGHFGSQAGVY